MPAVPLADALAVHSPARRLIGYTTATARHESTGSRSTAFCATNFRRWRI